MTEDYEFHLIFEWKYSDEEWVRINQDNERPRLEIDYTERNNNDEFK